MSRSIAGVVLAGGEGRRLGRVDKALIALAGRPLIVHVVERLRPQVSALSISVHSVRNSPLEELGLDLLPDLSGERRGPLAGILAALEWAAPLGATHVTSVPCDTPVFPPDLVARLAAALDARPQAAVALASVDGSLQPTFALWSVSLAEELRQFLSSGQSPKVSRFAARHGLATAEFACRTEQGVLPPFFNINTFEDLALARRLMENGAP
jgi:molybdopterin-guanine dinucleotide biosynthesis protein A